MKTIDKIVVAWDFSSISEAVLVYAADLAGQLQAELVVVHVVNKRDIESVEAAMSMNETIKRAIYLDDYVAAVQQERERRIREIMQSTVSAEAAPEILLRVGVPFQELIRAAAQIRADLIVMGTKGRTSADDAGFGSTAAKVFQYSPIPVLSVR